MILVIFFTLLIIALYVITTYNQFQTLKVRIRAAIQEIGNQFKAQIHALPSLQKELNEFKVHEKDIFKILTEARAAMVEATKSGSAEKAIAAQEKIGKYLGSVRVLAESTPKIQTVPVVMKLMDEISNAADQIKYANRTLIDLASDYNRLLVTFPSNIVGSVFGFTQEEGLKTPLQGKHLEVAPEELRYFDEVVKP